MQKEIEKLEKKIVGFEEEYKTASTDRQVTITLQIKALKNAIAIMDKKLLRGQTKLF